MSLTKARKSHLCIILMMLAFQTSAIANNAPERNMSIQVQSNVIEVGYQVGDVAHQTVIIHTPKNYVLDESSLPAQGKGAAYMELRKAQWQTQATGNTSQHKLELDWQIFRVMQETRAYSLKPLDLQFRPKVASDKVLTVHVNAARVVVASVLPTAMDAAHTKPLSDATPSLRNTHPMVVTLWLSFIGLLLSSLYIAWRFDWLPEKLTALFAEPKPFKRAYREIKVLEKHGDVANQISSAMRSLRRACDFTAGATLSVERLATLFERNGNLIPKRTEIEHFYAESERSFFAGSESTLSLKQLMQLSHQLMVLESI
jgi:hypothetical protein